MQDTIFAQATAPGRAGIAVIRLSGPAAFDAAGALSGGAVPFRRPVLRRLRDAAGRHLDTALVLGFGEGESFTGEATVEFHLHGSAAVTAAVQEALGRLPGLRLADPGEFTRRALENDRLDLAQVEGLADLIDAETEAQRRQALAVMSGAVGEMAERWRSQLIRATALIEVTIDFADEEVPVDVAPEVIALLSPLVEEMRREAAGAAIAERIRDGFEVAIVGRPNVGKSTLLNRLAGREAAITSAVAGTTRDVIEVRMDLRGLPVTLLDTAGFREAADIVEEIGVARARARADRADLRVFLVTAEDPDPPFEPMDGDIVVFGKSDLGGAGDRGVSGLTGEGVDRLTARVGDVLAGRAGRSGTAIRARQRMAIAEAMDYVEAARAEVAANRGEPELVAENLRHALRSLEILLGRVGVEDVLDVIFKSFCLGK